MAIWCTVQYFVKLVRNNLLLLIEHLDPILLKWVNSDPSMYK